MGIRADSAAEFTRIIEGRILPQLRGQKGCRHVDSFITPLLSEAVINSYWDAAVYAEAYNGTAYLEEQKALLDVTDGEARVETFYISSSTFHNITAQRRAEYRASQLGN